MATAEAAESPTCAFKLYVLTSADQGNLSQDRKFSSPVSFLSCPSRILAAVTVLIPIPSPMNMITFLAVWVSAFTLRFSLTSCCPSLNQGLLAWFTEMPGSLLSSDWFLFAPVWFRCTLVLLATGSTVIRYDKQRCGTVGACPCARAWKSVSFGINLREIFTTVPL